MKKWKNRTFKNQMMCIFLGTVVVTIFFCFMLFLLVSVRAEARERALRMEALRESVTEKLNTAIKSANEYSKIICSSQEVVDYLESTTDKGKGNIQSNSISILMGNNLIDGIYIYDFRGNYYASTTQSWKVDVKNKIQEASWYEDVMEANGSYILLDDQNDFFGTYPQRGLLMIRAIKEVSSLQTVGILVIDMSYDKIFDSAGTFPAQDYCLWCLLKNGSELVYGTEELTDNLQKLPTGPDTEELELTLQDKTYTGHSYAYNEELSIGVFSRPASLWGIHEKQLIWIPVFLLIEIVFLYLLRRFLNRAVTEPVDQVLLAMRFSQEGVLKKVDAGGDNIDMQKLHRGYNHLVDDLETMLRRVKSEQKQKRKYELDVLNAQIRPHFLYNTFDSVCALALMGMNDDVYQLMQSLGKYYRTSLHKGDEMIRLEEELAIIRNYAIIQNYRFSDVFTIDYEVEEELLPHLVLKLILQPFVENAIAHGIQHKHKKGKILIKACRQDQDMILTIRDDGLGMSQETIDKVLAGEIVKEEKSFGVYGTIERICLHYDVANPVTIQSELGQYTEICIRIPIVEYQQEKKNAKIIDRG